jgi:type IV pilus assembly protein PilC
MAFAYRARDPLGKIIEGTLAAASAADVTQELRREGLTVIEVQEENPVGPLFGGRITRKEIVIVTTQLSVMVETGITLSSALEGLIVQEKNLKLKTVLNDLKSQVEGGSDFSAALEKHPECFDKTYLALVRASEASGALGEMLDKISEYLRRSMDNRAKVRSSMAYPSVIGVLAVGVTIFLLTYVMPKFTPLFERQGIELPTVTIIMMKVSKTMTLYWYAWILGVIGAVGGSIWWLKTDQGRRAWDTTMISLPLLGPLFRKIILSRSVSTLGTMIASGVSTLEALRLCGEAAGNMLYSEMWLDVREKVTTGQQIWESMSGNPLVPGTLVQMISSGEQSGRLDFVLHKISSFYDREVETSLKTVTSMIEPLMIAVMGVVVGTIGLSLMLPIFSLSRKPH